MRRPGYLADYQPFSKTPLKSWAWALQSGDANQIIEQYAPDAVLLGTLSDRIKTGRADIKTYFDKLVKKSNLHVSFQEVQEVKPNVWAGKYTFHWDGGNLPSRFTFIVGSNGIKHHHSSALPKTA